MISSFSPIPESKVENQLNENPERDVIQPGKFQLQEYEEPILPPDITDSDQIILTQASSEKNSLVGHKQLSVVMEKGESQAINQEIEDADDETAGDKYIYH